MNVNTPKVLGVTYALIACFLIGFRIGKTEAWYSHEISCSKKILALINPIKNTMEESLSMELDSTSALKSLEIALDRNAVLLDGILEGVNTLE